MPGLVPAPLRRPLRRLQRRVRQARMLATAFRSPHAPVVAHLIPTRRCNLSCSYCNEFDDHSLPVPTAEVCRRIDRLDELGTGIVTMSGGEPLLHPDLDDLIRHVRRRGMIATVITNGYLLSVERIERLNRAGLDHLQISIDNLAPDDVSKKSLKVLDRKLEWLAAHADFDVTINVVVGAGVRRPEDAMTVAERASGLGLSVTIGLIHDHGGQLLPLDERNRDVLGAIVRRGRSTFDVANYNRFQKNLSEGRANDWHCRAGSRYLYICEDGLVHWCSQQRGNPGIPLERYSESDLRREYQTVKTCAPFCTVGCVHRVAQLDDLREKPVDTVREWFSPAEGQAPEVPASVRVLLWMFVTGPTSQLLRRGAARVLGTR
jgi:MoaA/NifB/PqqE/SkfB family radical SAM enzyme